MLFFGVPNKMAYSMNTLEAYSCSSSPPHKREKEKKKGGFRLWL